MFEEINSMAQLIKARAEAIKTANSSKEVSEINKSFQLRKKYVNISTGLDNLLQKIQIKGITLECVESNNFIGGIYQDGQLKITMPPYIFTKNGYKVISEEKQPINNGTFALYFSDKTNIVYYIIK